MDGTEGKLKDRFHFWGMAGLATLLVLGLAPYATSLGNSFCNDDWVILHYYRNQSLPALFSPLTLWFYRPLQSVLFVCVYRLAGLNPLPYNLVSMAMFALGSGLWCWLLARLVRGRAVALLATAFFLANWEYCDILLWKANYGTQLAWLGTLLALHAFLSYCRQGSARFLALSSIFFLGALLAKETSVNLPFLAALVYFFESRPERLWPGREDLLAGMKKIAPLLLVLLLYLAFHVLCVRDIEQVNVKGYAFASPWGALRQFLFALNHLFFFFAQSPLLAGLNAPLGFITHRLLFIPLLLLGWAVAARDRTALFGLFFAALTLMPQILLTDFHASRFYLIPAGGMGLVWAALTMRVFRALAASPRPLARLLRLGVPALLGLLLLRSEVQLYGVVEADRTDMRLMTRFYSHIEQNRTRYPADACLILDGLSDKVTEGLGLRQMAKILLGSERAEAFKNGQHLADAYARQLSADYPHKYLLALDRQGQVVARPLGAAVISRMN